MLFFFFKQKTAYEMRISDWSSDVCSSDLPVLRPGAQAQQYRRSNRSPRRAEDAHAGTDFPGQSLRQRGQPVRRDQIGLVEQDKVGAGKLVLEQFLDGAVMIQRRVGRAGGGERRLVMGEAARRQRIGVDQGD